MKKSTPISYIDFEGASNGIDVIFADTTDVKRQLQGTDVRQSTYKYTCLLRALANLFFAVTNRCTKLFADRAESLNRIIIAKFNAMFMAVS